MHGSLKDITLIYIKLKLKDTKTIQDESNMIYLEARFYHCINGFLFSILSVKINCLKSFKKAYDFVAQAELLRASNTTTKSHNQLHTN